jgi:hypothetical protein
MLQRSGPGRRVLRADAPCGRGAGPPPAGRRVSTRSGGAHGRDARRRRASVRPALGHERLDVPAVRSWRARWLAAGVLRTARHRGGSRACFGGVRCGRPLQHGRPADVSRWSDRPRVS